MNAAEEREIFCWDCFFHDAINNLSGYNRIYLNKRIDLYLSLHNSVSKLLDCIESNSLNILDVGSGPVPFLGRVYKKKFNLIPIDLLADEYYKLYKKYKIYPPNIPLQCNAEELSNMFPENYFDIVYARNSIDHSKDPLKCIQEMVKVSKKYVLLEHRMNEGKIEKYDGLHQWNFFIDNNNFYIGNKDEEYLLVSDYISDISIDCEVGFEQEENISDWLTVIIMKK